MALALSLFGCASMPPMGTSYDNNVAYTPSSASAPPVEGKRKIGKPYTIMGKWYYPTDSSEGYRKKGIASWYGDEFHGKPTANGEVYNMHSFTAAHTTLPLPTYVRVTNLENGRHIKVKVNDRGPFLRGRLIDMSFAGAKALGFAEQGTAPVLVEAYPTDGSALAVSPQQSADKTKKSVTKKVKQKRSSFTHRVSGAAHIKGKQQEQKSEKPKDAVKSVTTDVPIYVQTGAFSDTVNAKRQKNALSDLYNNVRVYKKVIKGKTFNRVRIGPLKSVDIADQVLARLINEGYKEAIIVVD